MTRSRCRTSCRARCRAGCRSSSLGRATLRQAAGSARLHSCCVRKAILLAAAACLPPACSGLTREPGDDEQPPSLEPVELTCEGLVDPLGIDVLRPELSWKLRSLSPEARGEGESAYRVLVASEPEALERDAGDLWDSGEVPSSRAGVEYAGLPLRAAQHAWWKVRVRDRAGRLSAWSAAAHWCTGPLEPSDWSTSGARWIGAGGEERALHLDGAQWLSGSGAPGEERRVFRRAFRIEGDRDVAVADLLCCAAQPLEVWLDGARVEVLAGGS